MNGEVILIYPDTHSDQTDKLYNWYVEIIRFLNVKNDHFRNG